MGIEQKIQNAHLITEVYGTWPSFHDAEVLRVTLDREGDDSRWGPHLDACIHTFYMTQEVDDRGYLVLVKHRKVHLRFHSVQVLYLEGFNNQNVLFTLKIVDISDRLMEDIHYEVTFEASAGMSASFQCHSVSVEAVDPWEPDLAPAKT